MKVKGIRGKKIVTLTLWVMTILINIIMSGCTSSQETFNPDGIQLQAQNTDKNTIGDKSVEDKNKENSQEVQKNLIEWKEVNDRWYCYNNYGVKQTGWINYGGKWYYTDPYSDGVMIKGWIFENGNWYYTNSKGAMETGFVNVDDVTYYFASNGVMQNNSTISKPEWKVEDNDISLQYSLLRSGDYRISMQVYDGNDKPIRECSWNYKKSTEGESRHYISICGRVGEMKSGDYLIANVAPTNDINLKVSSEKMKVIENAPMNLDTSDITLSEDENDSDSEYCNFTLKSSEKFNKGIYVLYGEDLKDSNNTFIGTSYCGYSANILEFSKITSNFINGQVANLKIARIYDIKIDNNLIGTCKIEVSDKFKL